MTYAGARGETARQMEQMLHFDQTKTNLHALFGRLEAALHAAQGSNELRIANALWPEEKYPFQAEFLDLVKKEYGATVTSLDYERKAEGLARSSTSGWTKNPGTRFPDYWAGCARHVTRMVLVNSIYFNGSGRHRSPNLQRGPDNFYVKPDTLPFRSCP
jgi:serpin B